MIYFFHIPYLLGHILLFSILAILSGANSYRKIHLFIHTHYETLNRLFGLEWKQVLAHTTMREIIPHTSYLCQTAECFLKYPSRQSRGQCVPSNLGTTA